AEHTALAQETTAQELEKLQLSGKFDHSTDVERLEAISPHPPGDQVDRTVVAGGMIKSASLWAIRLVVIGFFLYLLGEIIGSFWQGILPVVLSLIVCTVLSPSRQSCASLSSPRRLPRSSVFCCLSSSSAESFPSWRQTLPANHSRFTYRRSKASSGCSYGHKVLH